MAEPIFSKDPLFENFAVGFLLGLDGCPLGEIQATMKLIPDGDATAWHSAFSALGDRLASDGDAALAKGQKASALESYMRAAAYHRISYKPLFGAPTDPRLVAAFQKERGAFEKGASALPYPAEPIRIPYEGTTLPGFFIQGGAPGQRARTLICTDGYDETIYGMWSAYRGAPERGFNLLLFDGPGQGGALIEQGLVMRPDWENVVRPVVDYALTRPEVDPAKMALIGWSFGGYLAPRAAGAEHRLAALVADPGLYGLADGVAARFPLPEEALRDLAHLDAAVAQPILDVALKNPALKWSLQDRNLWVHGLTNVVDYLRIAPRYTLDGFASEIRCPTLITSAESDPLSSTTQKVFDAINAPKHLMHFTDTEGAGAHCEANNRPLWDVRVYDWLEETLA